MTSSCCVQCGVYSCDAADLRISIRMANGEQVREQATAGRNHSCVLLLGDNDNNVIYKTRIR